MTYKTFILFMATIYMGVEFGDFFKKKYIYIDWYSDNIPKSHAFVNYTIQSNIDITNIVSELNVLLPQLSDFINQFNNEINQNGINVITDSTGNMSIDVPSNMPNVESERISTRIGVIDRLITTRGQEINELLKKGLSMENKLKMENPNYVSQLSDKITEFKRLNDLYKH